MNRFFFSQFCVPFFFLFSLIIALFSSCLKTEVKPELNLVKTEKIYCSGLWLSNLTFFDQTNGIASLDNLCVKTTNGGISWVTTATSDDPIDGIYWGAADTVYYSVKLPTNAGYHEMFRSVNAGQTWTQIFTIGEDAILSFYNGTNGYAVSSIPPSSNTTLLFTGTAGNSWSQSSGSLPNINMYNSQLIFVDHYTGFIVNGDALYKTSDAGVSWTYKGPCKVLSNVNEYGTMYRAEPSGNIFKSTDWGDSWNYVYGGNSERISYIGFHNNLCCYIAPGKVCISLDGGSTWKTYLPIYSDGVGDFASFYYSGMLVVDNNHILISGRDATVNKAVLLKLTI